MRQIKAQDCPAATLRLIPPLPHRVDEQTPDLLLLGLLHLHELSTEVRQIEDGVTAPVQNLKIERHRFFDRYQIDETGKAGPTVEGAVGLVDRNGLRWGRSGRSRDVALGLVPSRRATVPRWCHSQTNSTYSVDSSRCRRCFVSYVGMLGVLLRG